MRATLQLCAGLPERTLATGETVLQQGERTGALWVLIDGTVEVVKNDMQIDVVSTPGAMFGEMSVLLDSPHVATVRTLTPCRFHVSDDAAGFLRGDPKVALAVARLLARRLHAVGTYLADLKRQFEGQDDHLGMVDEVIETLVHHQGEEHTPGSDRDPDPTVS